MKKKDFDFHQHVYEILKQRSSSPFIPYHEVNSYLGRRFCLRKQEIRGLIKGMEGRGYLKVKKRGIILKKNGKDAVLIIRKRSEKSAAGQ